MTVVIQRAWASVIGVASATIGILAFCSIVHIPGLDALVHIVTGVLFIGGAWDQQRAIRWPNKSLARYFLYRFRSDRYELGSHHCGNCFYTNWLIDLTALCSYPLPGERLLERFYMRVENSGSNEMIRDDSETF